MKKVWIISEQHQEQQTGQWTMSGLGSGVETRNDSGRMKFWAITVTGEDDGIRRRKDVAEEEEEEVTGIGCQSDRGNTGDAATESRYYNTIVGTSRNGNGGPRYYIGALVTEQDIIGRARGECGRSGESLVDLAGIGWKSSEEGDLEVAREWEPGEEFYTAIAKLNDEGRLYEIYDCESGVAAFLDRAEKLGIGKEARGKQRAK